MLYTTIREKLNALPSKLQYMKHLNLTSMYMGFRQFLKGEKVKLENKGKKNLLESLGYEFVEVPIKKNEDGTYDTPEEFSKFYDQFFEDLDKSLKPFMNGARRVREVRQEDNVILNQLQNHESNSKVQVNGKEIDLDIDVDDLF